MKCSEAMILLSAMLDGELSPREKLLLRRHLAACPRCKKERDELNTLRAFMSLWSEEEPSSLIRKSPSHKRPAG